MKYIYLKTNQRHFFMNTVIIIFDTLGLWAQYFNPQKKSMLVL